MNGHGVPVSDCQLIVPCQTHVTRRIVWPDRRTGGRMFVVVGRVEIKPGHEDETRLMIEKGGIEMVRAMPGSRAAYWARGVDFSDRVQHSFWLFETEEDALAAEATFRTLRDMREAPARFVSVEVCEVIGQA
jgi:hypothetical protein